MIIPLKSARGATKALRQCAEAQLKKQTGQKKTNLSDSAIKKVLHELQVHQIELEMQNEEIQQARQTEKLHYRYTELFEFAPIAYFAFDLHGIITQVNLRGATLLGIERANLVGQPFSNYITAQYRHIFKDCLAKAFGDNGIQSCEVLGQVGKHTFWLDIEANLGVTGTDCLTAMIDITERKLTEQKLTLAANVFTHAREGIYITDATGTIIDVNETFTTITGYSRAEVIGQHQRMLQSGSESPDFYADIWQVLMEKGVWSGELWNRHKNNEEYAEMLNISSVKNADGQISHYVALFTDITLMKEHQRQLELNAHYDLLTHLPNRVLLADRLSQAMLQCRRHQQSLAVVFLDLDGFKGVNDTHGHDVGDELLIALSHHMKEALREGDTLARIGGDEFVAVLADLGNVEDCEPLLERFLLAASGPVSVGEIVLKISASIGVTFYPQDNVDADLLMRHADQAMYVAKASGKNCYHLFDSAQDDAVQVQHKSLVAIRRALDKQEFVVYYQPKINMRAGSVIGCEALIRWQHPKRGLLNPLEFLPVIENNAMSIEMGEWVIDSALTQISQWQAMGGDLPVSISVNIAAIQLQQPDFTHRLAVLLAAHPDVEPYYLEIEVLETTALDDLDHVAEIMAACTALGIKFSLDDFGTGYSSLTYLKRLPVSQIKIDLSFVRDMLTDGHDLAIIKGIIALAKSFKLEVIAEGVETTEHGTALLQLGCELAQGYGIARPMPAGDIPEWVTNWKTNAAWSRLTPP